MHDQRTINGRTMHKPSPKVVLNFNLGVIDFRFVVEKMNR